MTSILMSVSSTVRWNSPRVVIGLEAITCILLPILFAAAIKWRVYTRFPASLFRWIMIVDWIASAWRIVQWWAIMPVSDIVDVRGKDTSMAACRTVAIIDTVLLCFNLFFTTCVVGSIFLMVCMEQRFTSISRQALPKIIQVIVWIASFVIAGISLFESNLDRTLGFCIGDSIAVLVKLVVSWLFLGIQAICFIPSFGTILLTAHRTKTRLSAGSYQYVAFVFAEAFSIIPILIAEFLATTRQFIPPIVTWTMLLLPPLCHLAKMTLFARHLWTQWTQLALETNKARGTGATGVSNGTQVSQGMNGGGLASPNSGVLDTPDMDRRKSVASRRGRFSGQPDTPRLLGLQRMGNNVGFESPGTTGAQDTFAWNDRRNTMLGGGVLEAVQSRLRSTPVPAMNKPPPTMPDEFPLLPPPAMTSIGSRSNAVGGGAQTDNDTRVFSINNPASNGTNSSFISPTLVRPAAKHLGVVIPEPSVSTGLTFESRRRSSGGNRRSASPTVVNTPTDLILLRARTPGPSASPLPAPNGQPDGLVPLSPSAPISHAPTHTRMGSMRRQRGPSLTAQEFEAVRLSLHPSKRGTPVTDASTTPITPQQPIVHSASFTPPSTSAAISSIMFAVTSPSHASRAQQPERGSLHVQTPSHLPLGASPSPSPHGMHTPLDRPSSFDSPPGSGRGILTRPSSLRHSGGSRVSAHGGVESQNPLQLSPAQVTFNPAHVFAGLSTRSHQPSSRRRQRGTDSALLMGGNGQESGASSSEGSANGSAFPSPRGTGGSTWLGIGLGQSAASGSFQTGSIPMSLGASPSLAPRSVVSVVQDSLDYSSGRSSLSDEETVLRHHLHQQASLQPLPPESPIRLSPRPAFKPSARSTS